MLIELSADADMEYDESYHHETRGRFWQSLKGTKYEKRHDIKCSPGFCFSNPFPPESVIKEGAEKMMLVSATDRDLLAHIAADLLENRELQVGHMPFTVTDIHEKTQDVGEPGTVGTLRTDTNIFISLFDHECEKYNIDHPGSDTKTFWRPEHGMTAFEEKIEGVLQNVHERYGADIPGPAEVDNRLFSGYELIDTYGTPLKVASDTELDLVVTKWKLRYEVQNEWHRQHLNLALDCGLGMKTGMGLGFVNIEDKQTPGLR